MSASAFDSAHLGALFGDPPTAAILSDAAAVAAMVAVERGLARAQGRLGIIPAEAAAALDAGLAAARVDPAELAAGTAGAGVPVPALLAALRPQLAPEAAAWLHWGATSQDIVDSALALRAVALLDLWAPRLDALSTALAVQARAAARTPMAGRTRGQIATPISFGLRVARWRRPFVDLRAELPAVRARIGRVQFGGAAGANSAVAPHGVALAAALAAELGLATAPCWHADRTPVLRFAGWCGALAAAVGKMAGDLILMARTEIGEARAGAAGSSSTMPQKANPVGAETAVALARWAGALTAPLHAAALHAEERDGAAWALEWLALPQMIAAAGGALRHAEALAQTLRADPARMRANLDLDGGAAMAEAASFLLAERMPRAEAQALVRRAAADPAPLAAALARLAPGVGDWVALLDPAAALDAAAREIEAALGDDAEGG